MEYGIEYQMELRMLDILFHGTSILPSFTCRLCSTCKMCTVSGVFRVSRSLDFLDYPDSDINIMRDF